MRGVTHRFVSAPVSIALLAAAVAIIGPRRVLDRLELVSTATVIVAAVAIALNQALMTWRWVALVPDSAIAESGPRRHAQIYLYSNFLNFFSPANLGGDAYRLVASKDPKGGRRAIAEALLRERLVGVATFLLGYLVSVILLLVLPGRARLPSVFVTLAGVVALLVALVLVSPRLVRGLRVRFDEHRHPRIVATLITLEHVPNLRRSRRPGVAIALSAGIWLTWMAAVALVARDLHMAMSFPLLAAIATLAEFVRLVPVSFQGVGVREGAFAFFVSMAGGKASDGWTLGIVVYLLLTLSLVLSGPASWLFRRGGWRRGEPELIAPPLD